VQSTYRTKLCVGEFTKLLTKLRQSADRGEGMNQQFQLYQGDCLNILPQIESEGVDCVVSDPPYPEIDREYGRMTESEWMDMMQEVVRQTRRILKPTGSAVFILQPNYERVGKMRTWLWKFMIWCAEEWNLIQDAYWWNYAALPASGSQQTIGLMRSSVKPCVWIGNEKCYRNQDAVLWKSSESVANASHRVDNELRYTPSGSHTRVARMAQTAIERGGSTPFNLIPMPNNDSQNSAGSEGHGAGTPQALADWWTRYLCPKGGVCADWFLGAGTMGLSAMKYGCQFVGIEQHEPYFDIALRKISEAARSSKGLPVQLAGTVNDYADAPLFAGMG
jgi:DNA modification methylase